MSKFSRFNHLLREEFRNTVSRPGRIRRGADPRRWYRKFKYFRHTVLPTERVAEQDSFVRRDYDSYQSYVRHQRAKLDAQKDSIQLLNAMRTALPPRIAEFDVKAGWSVLCLGARTGAECEAFRDAGLFPVGVDLNPGRDNPWVVRGDFHHLQYADHSVDLVFTNSLDHAFDIGAVAGEIHRVLKPGGRFWLEALLGPDDLPGRELMGRYEAMGWRSVESLVEFFGVNGFEVESRTGIEVPWPGVSVLFAASEESSSPDQVRGRL